MKMKRIDGMVDRKICVWNYYKPAGRASSAAVCSCYQITAPLQILPCSCHFDHTSPNRCTQQLLPNQENPAHILHERNRAVVALPACKVDPTRRNLK
jgi:hypothetical protein